jgi:hypothetical protein
MFQTLVYDIQNYRVSGHCTLFGILNTRKHNISEIEPFPTSDEGKETSTLCGPLDRANLSHWTQYF